MSGLNFDDSNPSNSAGIIAMLEAIASHADQDISLGAFISALGERVFGVLLFALAIPVCMPFLYGVPQIVALPMILLALQMAVGREEPWLPNTFYQRRLSKANLDSIAKGARKYFGWVEAFAKPRFLALSGPAAERAIGCIFVIFCASILVPLPLTNTAPGIAIALASIGLITRDGAIILLGLIMGLVWISLLTIGLSFFGTAFIDVIKEFIKTMIGAT